MSRRAMAGVVVLLVSCAAPAGDEVPAAVSSKVDLVTDEHGWPHAFAANLKDAAFAEGYAMARDRMPQLELLRRTSEGRLAEVFGAVSAKFIESDVTMRTIGLHRMAQALWDGASDRRMRDMFEGYAAGVNLYLAQLREGRVSAPRGSELLLGPRTPDWTPVDSLAVLRLMEMYLAFNADAEINRSLLRERAGPELFAELVRFAPPSTAATVSQKMGRARPAPSRTLGEGALALEALRRVLPAADRLGVGTNAWAISGSHTASGHALLANDPHLPLVAPSILWGVHFVVTEGPDAVDVTGVAFPGVPGVVFGHNPFVAWGITNAMFDQMDVYEETLVPGGAVFQGRVVPLATRVEQIPNGVGGTLEVAIETVPHHGPLLPVFAREGVPSLHQGPNAISVRWVADGPSHEVEGLIALMYSRTSGEAKRVVRDIEVPSMGFVLADRAGDIAFQMTGKLPLRASGAMTFDPVTRPGGTMPAAVLPGTGEAEWVGWLDPASLPCSGEAPLPFIAAANNDPGGYSRDGNPFDGPVYLGYDWSEGFRAERLTQRLGELDGRATREDMEALQADKVMLVAKRFRPFLLEAAADTPWRDVLAAWDFDATEGSVAAAIFHAWLARLLDFALTDDLEAMAGGGGVAPVLAPQQRMIAVLAALEGGRGSFWDDRRTAGVVETRGEISKHALGAAVDDLTALTGSTDPAAWRWGPLHTVQLKSVIPHYALSLFADLSIPQGRGGFPRGGGIDTVDQGWPVLQDEAGRPAAVFRYTQGAARRFTVELTPDGPLAFDALPGGESGDLSSPHFRDEAELWRANRSHPLWRTRAEVEAHAERRTTLLPGG